MYVYLNTYITHTHTRIYIYIYIYMYTSTFLGITMKSPRNQVTPQSSFLIVRRSYGIQPSYVCVFQIALLQTLCQNLNGLSLQAEISWSVVWSHFVVAPFLQGARESGGVMRYNKLSGRGYDNPLGKIGTPWVFSR